jgi:hypothetical protein
MSDLGLENLIDHFRQKHVYRERYPRRMRCNTAVVRARCDLILGTEKGMFRNVFIQNPRDYSSDHLMVLGMISYKPKQENYSYSKQGRCFPLELDKRGPHTRSNQRIYNPEIIKGRINCPHNSKENRIIIL